MIGVWCMVYGVWVKVNGLGVWHMVYVFQYLCINFKLFYIFIMIDAIFDGEIFPTFLKIKHFYSTKMYLLHTLI